MTEPIPPPSPPPVSAVPASPAARRPSLFWRLFPSYLLVIAVGAGATFWAGAAFAPFFLEQHVAIMLRSAGGATPAAGFEAMTSDLNAAYRTALTQSLALAVAVAVSAAVVVGLFVTRRIVAPLRALKRASRRIAGGTYRDRLDPATPGEIGDLVEAFNRMAATLESTEAQRVALLADVAHEFRTPLSSLRGYLEGLEDGVFSFDTPTAAACRRQLERLERLVDDLGLLSRVEAGRLELHPVPLAVAERIARIGEAFHPQCAQRRIALALAVDAGAEGVEIFADPERTDQVFANLIDNALRYTPEGGSIVVRARRETAEEVRFEVEDSGSGIPPAQLPRVFDRFWRGDASRGRDDGSGSGIGLTLVREFVERSGGSVGVESPVVPGAEGTRFWFTLPVHTPRTRT